MKKLSIFLMMLCLACFGVAKAQTTVLSENFDSMTSLATSYSATDWYAYNASSANNWTISTTSSYAHSGSKCARYNYSSSYDADCYLVSAPFNVSSNMTKLEVSLYERTGSYTETFEVFLVNASEVTDNASIVSATHYSVIASADYTNTTYAEVSGTVTSSALAGQSVRVVVHCTSEADMYWLGIDDITVSQISADDCIAPKNLAATTDGQTATLTWEGTAAKGFNIEINGTPAATGQTSPYTFNVALSTTYNVSVTADCGGGNTSDPVSTSFTTPDCLGGHIIEYTLNDSYGDGWNGNAIQVIEGCDVVATLTINNGSTASGTLMFCGDYINFSWVKGSYPGETSWSFTEGGTVLFSGAGTTSMATGYELYTIGTQLAIPTDLANDTPGTTEVLLTWTAGDTETAWQLCVNGDESNPILVNNRPRYTLNGLTPDTDYSVQVRAYIDATTQSCWSDALTFTTAVACDRPTNLSEENITTTSAHLSWTGTSDSYMVQYSPWYATGDDVLPTGTMKTYTFDLSAYTGTGSIVIRHYDVTNMFRLIVDNIVVTNAAGTEVYSQDFENCGGNMPSEFTNMDMDGDGYVWEVVDNSASYVNGNYGLSSASWTQSTDALTPDNWLVLSGITLGGSISFQARGQDANFAAENFNVYVCPDSEIHEDPAATNSYDVTGLPPYTPVAWQVKGFCGTDESRYVSSFFTTLDDVLIFGTQGNWNELSNWTDVSGNAITTLPTITNKVRIDEDVTIPAGVVATAKKATLNGGTITIADGGQMKLDATVDVIVEKEIAGYETGDANWYFIASPLTTTRLSYMSGWSYVNAITGTYDLYTFDPTQNFEWVNYKNNSSHANFTSGSNNPVLVSMNGYLYAHEDDYTLVFEGSTALKSYNTVETLDLTLDGTSTDDFNGFTLVGNPFTCDAYINFVDASNNVLAADYYKMNNTGNGFDIVSSSVALPMCAGAIIDYSQVGSGTVQFNSESTGSKSGALDMNVTNGQGKVDMARVRFGEGLNLRKMSFRENNSKLYMSQNGEDFAVVYADNQGEMPVSFKAAENGTYTISFNTENVEFGYLHLIDNMTGTDVDLLANPSYTFNANTNDYASRFRLMFAAGNDDNNFAFVSNGEIILNGQGTVQVYDVTGRMISSHNDVTSIATDGLSAGVYMLRLINGSDIKTQKIVVK